MEDSFSHQLQITAPKACLAENVAAGMEQLMQLYVEPRRHRGRQAPERARGAGPQPAHPF